MLIELIAKILCPFSGAKFHTPPRLAVLAILGYKDSGYRVYKVEYNNLFRPSFCPYSPDSVDILKVPLHDGKQSVSEMLAAQCFGIDRPLRVRPPANGMDIVLLAGANGDFPFSRM